MQQKFRAISHDTGEFEYSDTHGISDFFNGIESGRYDESTLGIYTHLKDKNNTLIYEGDVLETDTGIYYVSQALPFIRLIDKNDDDYQNDNYYESSDIQHHDWETFKVVANIYDSTKIFQKKS